MCGGVVFKGFKREKKKKKLSQTKIQQSNVNVNKQNSTTKIIHNHKLFTVNSLHKNVQWCLVNFGKREKNMDSLKIGDQIDGVEST